MVRGRGRGRRRWRLLGQLPGFRLLDTGGLQRLSQDVRHGGQLVVLLLHILAFRFLR
jgi:hypothetical protein